MEYETSYDTGQKPFNHDKNRGKWASSKDFFFACAGHAFKADAIIALPILIFEDFGIYALLMYFVTLAVCVVPIVFLQSFLGQFSGTGFITVFRISPLFKGIGYVSLVVNFLTLTYYSIFSAIPLFYFFHSLRPTIPWSCEGSAEWRDEEGLAQPICIHNAENQTYLVSIPSVEFFQKHLNIATSKYEVTDYSFSLEIMACTCIIWGIVTFVILNSTEIIGRFIRYSFLGVVAIMSICLIRFAFLPGAIDGIWDFLRAKRRHMWETWIFFPSIALATLGPGYGSVLTMASFNNFKTNIFTYSWVLCLAQCGLMFGMAYLSIFIKCFMEALRPESRGYYEKTDHQWLEFLNIPTGLTFMELPHFWSLLFFSMLILGSLNILIIQLLSLITSLFDEFEGLREMKRKIIFGVVGFLTVTSILFCSNYGVYFFTVLARYAGITQMVLNLLLLLVVLWIYGRERFQRDVNFMTSRIYPTWMVNIVRFVAPLFLLFGLLIAVFISMEFNHSPTALFAMGTLIFLFSWFLIPGYCIFQIKQTTGGIGIRLRRCIRPTDWYPADPVYKQRYEENFNSGDISHQLTTTATLE